MIEHVVIFGAAGDLTRRYLLPAVAELEAGGHLPEDFAVTGVAFDEMRTEEYQDEVRDWLGEHAAHVEDRACDALCSRIDYVSGDATEVEDARRAIRPDDGPSLPYLALPPDAFGPAVRALSAAGLPSGSVLVIEKPFGHDLDAAQKLNAIVHECLDEEKVFRIDHFLGMQTVRNILGLRFANRLLDRVWSRDHIERIEIVWDETLTLEGRAFYDEVGAVRDMTQNHLLQLLCLLAMEPPDALDHRTLRDRKVELLRQVGRLDRDAVADRTVRARYGAGEIDGRSVPAYTDEDGVDPERETETFAEVELEIDNARWEGVRFVLRTGKALGTDDKHVSVVLRQGGGPFGDAAPQLANHLRIELEPEALELGLNITTADEELAVEPIRLEHHLARGGMSAYARVLLAALNRDPTLSIRDDEIEESWAIADPILRGWALDAAPLREYPAGSAGPDRTLLRPFQGEVSSARAGAPSDPGTSSGGAASV